MLISIIFKNFLGELKILPCLLVIFSINRLLLQIESLHIFLLFKIVLRVFANNFTTRACVGACRIKRGLVHLFFIAAV
jgi:hypothetical protein